MNNTEELSFVEQLKNYFDSTPREKILEDWKKSEHLDSVGITVEEFIKINIDNIKK